MEDQKVYIYPANAKKKMKQAKDNGQNVYIYGISGYGKTELVNHYITKKSDLVKLDVEVDSVEAFDIPRKATRQTVIIDNLQYANDEETKEAVKKLVYRDDLWVIITSRAACPDYLISYNLKGDGFVEISEGELALSVKELGEFFTKSGLILEDENLEKIQKLTYGHGMAAAILARIFARDMQKNGEIPAVDESLTQRFMKILADYTEHEIFDKWDSWLADNIMRLSIVESFDKELAECITGTNQIELLFKRATEVGNFLTIKDGMYSIEYATRTTMLRRMEKKYTKEEKNELYYNAGRYYKQHGKTIEALEMFYACNNTRQTVEILNEIAKTEPGNMHLYNLRHYYYAMESKTEIESPEIMAGLSMLYSLTMNIEKSEYWFERLAEEEKKYIGARKKEIKTLVAYLNIALAHRGSKGLVKMLPDLVTLAMNRKVKIPEFCVTGNSPSNMNGGKDFCEWTKRDAELEKAIGPALKIALGKHGAGLVDLAMAESLLEKAQDDYEVIRRISKGMMKAESGRIEEMYVGEGLLAKLHVAKGNIDDAREVIESFKKKAVSIGAANLIPNIENFLCQLDMLSGNSGKYLEWMEKSAPDENEDFFIMEKFRYITKLRIYITQGKYLQAQSLLERLLYYADKYERKYIEMECLLLKALLEYRTEKESWTDYLQEAYEKAEEYHFVRVLSKEGAAVLPLFENAKLTIKDKAFYNQVMEEMKNIAKYYPDYMKTNSYGETFPENALQILRLQAQGYSNQQIANELELSISTVKYHCRENYQKLGATNRVGAIAEAKKRRLI